jgi:uncharacterized protein YegL
MESHTGKMINGLNKFIETLKTHPNHANISFSLVVFCHIHYYIYCGYPITTVERLFNNVLSKTGTTHLYDAIGAVIQDWITEKNVEHNLFIITDGEDNGSKNVTKEQAIQLCNMAVGNNWNITHCDVDISKLDSSAIKQVVYNINNLEVLLENLSI